MQCPICETEHIRSLENKRRSFFRCIHCGYIWASPKSTPTEIASHARYKLHQNNINNEGYVNFLNTIIDRAFSQMGLAQGYGVLPTETEIGPRGADPIKPALTGTDPKNVVIDPMGMGSMGTDLNENVAAGPDLRGTQGTDLSDIDPLATKVSQLCFEQIQIIDWGSGPSPVCATLLQNRGFPVATWDPFFASEIQPKLDYFDLGICIEVAEHFLNPMEDFLAFIACLKPGGFAIVHTHLVEMSDDKFLSWWYTEDPTHVSFYSTAALSILARKLNVSIEVIEDGKIVIFRRPRTVLVVGGANLDVEGHPFTALSSKDSNPGFVSFSPGGTGRNIAENLSRLNIPVELITALGDDSAGTELAANTAASGVGISGLILIKGEQTSSYLSILDSNGDMAVAISSMSIYDKLSKEQLFKALECVIKSAQKHSFLVPGEYPISALVLDTNLTPETIKIILDCMPDLPIWLDPVSTTKTALLFQEEFAILGYLSCIKPNILEASTLAEIIRSSTGGQSSNQNPTNNRTNNPITQFQPLTRGPSLAQNSNQALPSSSPRCLGDPDPLESDILTQAIQAARTLRSSGVRTIHISLGASGVLSIKGGKAYLFSPPKATVVSATGAGDAFLSGALRASLLKADFFEEVASGCACAAITLASKDACSADLSVMRLEKLLSSWKNTGALPWKEIEL